MHCGAFLAVRAHAVSYLEELEKRFHEDPASVDRSWGSFFNNLGECTHTSCPVMVAADA